MTHGFPIAISVIAAACLCAQTPVAPPKAEGIPPRAAPTDYQFHAPAGPLTIAAEFTGHSVGTDEGTLTTEEYVAVEVALYGLPGTRARISRDDFSLRVNGKKSALTSQPYGLVVKTLKDPNIEPTAAEQKSKTSVSTGGGGGAGSSTPPPFRVPDAVRHEWSQRLQKISLPEGDRALPVGGLIYFAYHGNTEKIESLELNYSGQAGKATLALQP